MQDWGDWPLTPGPQKTGQVAGLDAKELVVLSEQFFFPPLSSSLPYISLRPGRNASWVPAEHPRCGTQVEWPMEGCLLSNCVGLGTFARSFFISQDFCGQDQDSVPAHKNSNLWPLKKQEAQEEKHKTLSYHFSGLSKLSKPL